MERTPTKAASAMIVILTLPSMVRSEHLSTSVALAVAVEAAVAAIVARSAMVLVAIVDRWFESKRGC
jgi:hypothetical protein